MPLRRAIASADLISIHGYRHWLPLWAALISHIVGKPYLCHLHGMANMYPHGRLKKRVFDASLGRWILPRASHIVCNSKRERTALLSIVPGLQNITVIPHGIDVAQQGHGTSRWTHELGLDAPGRRRIILTLSRICATKNLLALVNALPLIPECTLVMAGPVEDQSYCDQLRAAAVRCGASDRFRLVGPVFGADKDDLYGASDVFVTTSLVDSFNLTVAEACSHGLPVIYPKWIGIAEYLSGAGTQAISDTTPQTVANAIRRALASSDRSINYERLKWESIWADYKQVFKQCIIGKSAAQL